MAAPYPSPPAWRPASRPAWLPACRTCAAALGCCSTVVRWPLMAERTTMSRPLEPGTEPLISSSWRSASMRTISRFCDGALHVAQMAGHALAREHAARALVLADRARHVVRDRVAVRARFGREVVALDHAGEALADGHALHVDLLADLEDVDADLAADLEVGELIGLATRNSRSDVAGFDGGLGEVAGQRLARRGSRGACRTRPARRNSRRSRRS